MTTSPSVATKVAVIGSGISGAVCASALAKNGISVTIFESGRGPGGRMSQRRWNYIYIYISFLPPSIAFH
ncbi:unnamed protein product [Coffea canephora]|uniref:Amine oxidase domain-containing protein n=1 Tax=Coffea canephora TaxID=49390 RepID=A0A068UYK4_COFCA|nr:unnamed protein product [Coffea canephora]